MEGDQMLTKMEHFFKVDTTIKKEMYKCVPPTDNEYIDEHSIEKYTKELEEFINYTFIDLKRVAVSMFGENTIYLKKLKEMEQTIKEKFYNCGFNIDKLRSFYHNYITNMDEKFVEKVKENCVGYKWCTSLPIKDAKTINEILHLLHADIINSEYHYAAIPAVDSKTNDYNYPINYRGKYNETFYNLYNSIPYDLDVGITDMLCINDKKLIMMIRDRGHAATIEITINGDNAKIEYFIPKLCNIEENLDRFNNLPGISKVNLNSQGAMGITEVEIEHLPDMLIDFISRIPVDGDIAKEYYYSPDKQR